MLATAKTLADMLDATVVALHVGEGGAPSPEALAKAARVEFRQIRGTPLEGIVKAASEADVAALVLGSRGASAGPRPAGATALEVITRTAKPVVLVPPDAHPPERFTRLLLPIEGQGAAPPALSHIIDAAHRRKLEIIVLHLHSPATVPAFSDHEPHGTRAWDQEFLARHLPFKPDRVTVLRRVGTPADDVPAARRGDRRGANRSRLEPEPRQGARPCRDSHARQHQDPGAPPPDGTQHPAWSGLSTSPHAD